MHNVVALEPYFARKLLRSKNRMGLGAEVHREHLAGIFPWFDGCMDAGAGLAGVHPDRRRGPTARLSGRFLQSCAAQYQNMQNVAQNKTAAHRTVRIAPKTINAGARRRTIEPAWVTRQS
jgi:hypothetical protein